MKTTRSGFTLALFSVTFAAATWLTPWVPLARRNFALINLLKRYERATPRPTANPEAGTSSDESAFHGSVSWLTGLVALNVNHDRASALNAWKQAAVENGRLLSRVGHNSWNQGQRRRAVDYVRLAAAVDPENTEAVATMTAWSISLGDLERAAFDLDGVLSAVPRNAVALACRGYVAFRQGSASDGRRYLDQATLIAPDDRTVIAYEATFLLESRAPADQLEPILRRGDKLYGDFHESLAKLYIAQKRYDEAAPYVTKLLAERPGDAYARETVGGYYFLRGRYQDALEQYQAASRMVPTEPRFFINVGQAEIALNHRAASIDAYCAAMKLDATGSARALLSEAGAECRHAP